MQANRKLQLVTPVVENRAVAPVRRPNSEFRSREHLTPTEVEKLIEAAKSNRHGLRDATMILVAYRHALRASEVCDLEWAAIDCDAGVMHVRRAKNGKPATHPIRGDELRALRKLQREGAAIAVRLRVRARRPVHHGQLQLAGQESRAESQAAVPVPRPHAASFGAAISWPATVTTPARSKPISATAIFGTPSDTPN